MSAKKKFEIYDRHGNLIEDDDSEVLKDGQRLRVPLYLADSMDPLQRSVAEHSARTGGDRILRRATRAEITTDASPMVVDAFGGTDGLHRPGARYPLGAIRAVTID